MSTVASIIINDALKWLRKGQESGRPAQEICHYPRSPGAGSREAEAEAPSTAATTGLESRVHNTRSTPIHTIPTPVNEAEQQSARPDRQIRPGAASVLIKDSPSFPFSSATYKYKLSNLLLEMAAQPWQISSL